jgi:hypothetical protein
MPLEDPDHCGEPMKLARLIPRSGVLPELLVFVCTRCGQTVSREQPELRDDPSLPKPSTPS